MGGLHDGSSPRGNVGQNPPAGQTTAMFAGTISAVASAKSISAPGEACFFFAVPANIAVDLEVRSLAAAYAQAVAAGCQVTVKSIFDVLRRPF
jgi:hypothetical protein